MHPKWKTEELQYIKSILCFRINSIEVALASDLFVYYVKAANTKGELMLTRVGKQSQKCIALGESFDTLWQIGISLAVAGDAAAEPRDDMLCVKVIEGAEEWAVGSGQFEYHHAATGF